MPVLTPLSLRTNNPRGDSRSCATWWTVQSIPRSLVSLATRRLFFSVRVTGDAVDIPSASLFVFQIRRPPPRIVDGEPLPLIPSFLLMFISLLNLCIVSSSLRLLAITSLLRSIIFTARASLLDTSSRLLYPPFTSMCMDIPQGLSQWFASASLSAPFPCIIYPTPVLVITPSPRLYFLFVLPVLCHTYSASCRRRSFLHSTRSPSRFVTYHLY